MPFYRGPNLTRRRSLAAAALIATNRPGMALPEVLQPGAPPSAAEADAEGDAGASRPAKRAKKGKVLGFVI